MSYLKVVLSEGNKNAELEIEQSDEKQRNEAVSGLFRFFGDMGPVAVNIQSPSVTPLIGIPSSPPKTRHVSSVPQGIAKTVEEGEAVVPQLKYKPEKPPLIGSERSLQTPIGEFVSESEPEWYKTGIKYKEGIPHYRLRLWCKNPACRGKGNDYILPDQLEVTCRDCGTPHLVRPAAPKGARDDWGNFFIADKLADTEDGR